MDEDDWEVYSRCPRRPCQSEESRQKQAHKEHLCPAEGLVTVQEDAEGSLPLPVCIPGSP